MVTIRDVAKHAGVSASTVSRTLSGVAFVNEDVQKRVWQSVRELDYRPNQAARSLKRGGSKLVGLVLPDITNPFYPHVVQCMESCAVQNGYSLILCDAVGDVNKEIEYFETLKRLFVDGILYIASTESIDHVIPFIGEIPMVIINRYFEVNAPCMNIDNVDAAFKAMYHLLSNGHRRVVIMVSDKERQYNRERMEGVRLALEKFGMSLSDCVIIRGVSSDHDIYANTRKVFSEEDNRPTAIFLFNDYMAFAAYRGVFESGLRIPEDVSIIGFDDIPFVQYMFPPLTTIRHSISDAADEIFDTLLRQMESRVCAPHSYVKYKSQLIIRESVRDVSDITHA